LPAEPKEEEEPAMKKKGPAATAEDAGTAAATRQTEARSRERLTREPSP
jgi:hypothetical protein